MGAEVQTRRIVLTVFFVLLGIWLLFFAVYFFDRLDHVVHNDLYNYGLQFSIEWAQRYWTFARLMVSFIVVAVLTIGVSSAVSLFQARARKSYRDLICALVLLGVLMIGFSMFLFTFVNNIVNRDLYRYGLQFSSAWYGRYVTNLDLFLGFLGATIALEGVLIAYLFSDLRFAHTLVRKEASSEVVAGEPAGLVKGGAIGSNEVLPEGRPEQRVKPLVTGSGEEQEVVGDKALLIVCPNCKKTFRNPLIVLDFRDGKPRMVNVCPYCKYFLRKYTGSSDQQ